MAWTETQGSTRSSVPVGGGRQSVLPPAWKRSLATRSSKPPGWVKPCRRNARTPFRWPARGSTTALIQSPLPLLARSQKRPAQISTKNKSGSDDRANVAFYTSDEFINIDCFIIKSSFIVSMTKISRSLILAIFLYFIITNKLVKKFLNHIILIQICKIYDYLAANLTILDPRWVLTQVRFRLHGEGRPPDRSVLRISAETRTTAESRTIRIRSKEDT